MLVPARVTVPGSTSNLGAGFDTVGMAVARHLTAHYQPGGSELVVRREGELAALTLDAADDLMVRAFSGELAEAGHHGVGGTLVVSSDIPIGRGLGSSGAAVVAGLLLASAVQGDQGPDRNRLLERALEMEGHGDNVGPSLFGGLVLAFPTSRGGMRAVPLEVSPSVAFAFAAPPVAISTSQARSALPADYPRSVAVGALGRLAALLHGLGTGDPDALAVGLGDELHVPYRLPLIPGGTRALEAARLAGAWGATISGSGSGVLAVCSPDLRQGVAAAMERAFRDAGHREVMAFPLDPQPRGGVIQAGS